MSKGVFIEGVTVEMLRNASLEAIETLLNEGYFEDVEISKWIPVSEALPSEGQVVLAIGDKGTWDVGKFQGTVGWTDDERIWWWKKKAAKRVEYWMPKDAFPLPSREERSSE